MQLRRADVVEAAIGILDEYGLADLTMRRLASALAVQPGALYWHFPNKQALLGAVADRILQPMDEPVSATDWEERLIELAARLRDCLLTYRDGAELVSATYASRLTTSNARERLAATVLRAGTDRRDAEYTAYTVLYYVLGHTVDEQSRIQLDSVGGLPDGPDPLIDTADPATRFDFGLQLLIGGIRHRLGDRVR